MSAFEGRMSTYSDRAALRKQARPPDEPGWEWQFTEPKSRPEHYAEAKDRTWSIAHQIDE